MAEFGPWTVGAWQNVEHRLVPPAHAYPIKGEFGNVAFVIGSDDEARLIAAAPDLLAALERGTFSLDYDEQAHDYVLHYHAAYDDAEALKSAIARATGTETTGQQELQA